MRIENKRHTNAHQPLTSLSATEASIPPSPPQRKSSINMRLFEPCYYFSRALGFSWTPNCDENESEITRRCV